MGACTSKQSKNKSEIPNILYFSRPKGKLISIQNNKVKEIPAPSQLFYRPDSAIGLLSKNRLMLIGGSSNSQLFNTVSILHLCTLDIFPQPEVPIRCKNGQIHEVGEWIYYIGGQVSDEPISASVYRYSQKQQIWQEIKEPQNRGSFKFSSLKNFGSCVIGKKIFIFGGEKMSSSGILKANKLILSLTVDQGFFLKTEGRLPVKVNNPVVAGGENYAIIAGGKNPSTGLNVKHTFYVKLKESVKIKEMEPLNIEFSESYPAEINKEYAAFVFFPYVAVIYKGKEKWKVYHIFGKNKVVRHKEKKSIAQNINLNNELQELDKQRSLSSQSNSEKQEIPLNEPEKIIESLPNLEDSPEVNEKIDQKSSSEEENVEFDAKLIKPIVFLDQEAIIERSEEDLSSKNPSPKIANTPISPEKPNLKIDIKSDSSDTNHEDSPKPVFDIQAKKQYEVYHSAKYDDPAQAYYDQGVLSLRNRPISPAVPINSGNIEIRLPVISTPKSMDQRLRTPVVSRKSIDNVIILKKKPESLSDNSLTRPSYRPIGGMGRPSVQSVVKPVEDRGSLRLTPKSKLISDSSSESEDHSKNKDPGLVLNDNGLVPEFNTEEPINLKINSQNTEENDRKNQNSSKCSFVYSKSSSDSSSSEESDSFQYIRPNKDKKQEKSVISVDSSELSDNENDENVVFSAEQANGFIKIVKEVLGLGLEANHEFSGSNVREMNKFLMEITPNQKFLLNQEIFKVLERVHECFGKKELREKEKRNIVMASGLLPEFNEISGEQLAYALSRGFKYIILKKT